MVVLYLEAGKSESSFQLENCMMPESQEKYYGQDPEKTLKVSINMMLPTCDDKGVFTDDDDTLVQETQVVYSVRRLVGGRGRRRWL
jgi:hypothetical protein